MNIKERLSDIINLVETRSGFFFAGEFTYGELCSFFNGYLITLPLDGETGIIGFSQWLSNKYGKSSLHWAGYIFYLLAKENETEAKKIVFNELKAFVSSIKDNIEVYCLHNDELTEFEALSKGWRNDIYVNVGPVYFHLNVYDIVRLQQDFKTEVEYSGVYICDPNMILVNQVSRDEIKRQVGHLVENKFFENIKPVNSDAVKKLHLVPL